MVVIVSKKLVAGTEAVVSEENLLGNNLNLRAEAQSSPDMTVLVKAGQGFLGHKRVEIADTNSGTFTAPVSNSRIDVVSMTSTGGLIITQGTATVSPVIPNFPNNNIPICAVWLHHDSTVINNTSTGTQGYIYQDLRRMNIASGCTTDIFTTGEAYSAGDALYLKSSDGKVYKADADATESSFMFIGFAAEASGGANESRVVITSGLVTGLSLTAGVSYYVSGTAGAISTTAGTYAMRVGVAVSTTGLLICKGNVSAQGTGTRAYNSTAGDVTITCGFRPSVIRMQGQTKLTGNGNWVSHGICAGSTGQQHCLYNRVDNENAGVLDTARIYHLKNPEIGAPTDYTARIKSFTETGFVVEFQNHSDDEPKLYTWEAWK
jgi:hypothetical protein